MVDGGLLRREFTPSTFGGKRPVFDPFVLVPLGASLSPRGNKKNAFVHLIPNVYVYCKKKKIRKVLLLNVAHDFS